MIRFRGALPPETGVPFVNRLDKETDRQWRTARREGRREARSVLAADAFVELTSAGRRTGREVEAAVRPMWWSCAI